MKNVLLLVHDDVGQEARLQAALDLTRILDGHLTCLDVTTLPDAGDIGASFGAGTIIAEERQIESLNKVRVDDRLRCENVAWDWVDAVGTLADSIADAADLADVIVLNRRLDAAHFPDMRDVTGRILMDTRKPVLAVPDSLRCFRAQRVLIAWDGGESVAATMRASIPLLKLAAEVRVMMARAPRSAATANEAVDYLARHGIHANLRYATKDSAYPVDRIIEDECLHGHADYVLMGAYGRGRFMETFGGVTKRMLTHGSLPLLLSH